MKKQKTAYQWKADYFKADPNLAGAVCEELSNTIGLTAKNLVDVSRPINAPLHNDFEWNNSKAAELYRERQARNIIVNLVTVKINKKDVEPTRAFFNLDHGSHKTGNYEPTSFIVSVPEKRNQLLSLAMQELRVFKRKYAQLKELNKLFELIDEMDGENND